MAVILTKLIVEDIDNCKFVRLHDPFIFRSEVLQKAGLESRVIVPTGFVYDEESIPIVRGSNKRGGTAHDYLCRIDSIPIVTKAQAAAVYKEVMQYCYEIDREREKWQKLKDWTRTWIKWGVVRVAFGYFHKFTVEATGLEIAGVEGDPYVTVEKLDTLIDKSEKVTSDIKDVQVPTAQKDNLIDASEKVTADLQDAKKDAEAKT
jgi:hypothetical protein